MTDKIKFNKEVFDEVHKSNLVAAVNMVESLEGIGDYREACSIEILKALAGLYNDIFDAVDTGKKKIVMHQFMMAPEILRGFPDVQPYMAESLGGVICMMEPDGIHPFLDAAHHLFTNEPCASAVAFLGLAMKEALPPAAAMVMPTVPCDSFGMAYQIVQKIMDAPMIMLDVPYWQDEQRNLDYYTDQVWKMIRFIEETCKTKMDWDLLREVFNYSNETLEYWRSDNEMRKLSPCPHGGKVNFYGFVLNFIGAGAKGVRDAWKFVYEDAKKLVAEKKGVVPGGEKARVLWYNPDPFYDPGIHDWMEDEYGVVAAFSLFGHATPTPVETSTPEKMVRDYAWKCMNMCMAKQYRGPIEYFMDELTYLMDNWKFDGVIIPLLIECKHFQASHAWIREACRERDLPLMIAGYSPMDNRMVTVDQLHGEVGKWIETSLLPYCSRK